MQKSQRSHSTIKRCLYSDWPHDDKLSHHAFLSLFTDNSSEESSATAEKEEETEESDHEGEPFTFRTGINHCISLILICIYIYI